MAKILITGICGSLARLTADRLLKAGHEIIGVDYRRKRAGLRPEIQFYRANYNKRTIEEVFRKHKPERVLHLGRVGNLKAVADKRFDLNVVGSAKIMELCVKHSAKRLVVLSTFHIYGAHNANHIPIFEEEPLRAAATIPQLADAVQLDNQACTWVYRHRKLKTIVLRPANVVGPQIRNAISTYLRQSTKAYLLGFSPMWQFVHELDMVDALLLATDGNSIGVYNIAGSGELPIVEALNLSGGRVVPVLGSLANLVLRVTGNFTIPAYFLDFLKYPCVIGDSKFRDETGYQPQISMTETIMSTVRAQN